MSNNKPHFWSWSVLEKLSLDSLQNDTPKSAVQPSERTNLGSGEKIIENDNSIDQTIPILAQTPLGASFEQDAASSSTVPSGGSIASNDVNSKHTELLRNLIQENSILEQSFTSAKIQIDRLGQDNEIKSTTIAKYEQELNNWKLRSDELSIKIEVISHKNEELLEKNQELERYRLSELELQLVEKIDMISELEESLLRSKKTNSELSASLAELTSGKCDSESSTKYEGEIISLRNRVEGLEKRRQLQREASASTSLHAKSVQIELTKCSDALKDSCLKVDQLRAELTSRDSKVKELTKEIGWLSSARDAGEASVLMIRSECEARMRQQCEELQRVQQSLKSATAMLSATEARVVDLQKEAIMLKAQRGQEEQGAQGRIDEYKRKAQAATKDANSRAADAQRRAEDLEAELMRVREEAETVLTRERDLVIRLRQELEHLSVKQTADVPAVHVEKQSERAPEGHEVAPTIDVLSPIEEGVLAESVGEDEADRSADELFYISELREQNSSLRRDLTVQAVEIDKYVTLLDEARADKRRLQASVEELSAFRSRTLTQGDQGVNREYLKTCVLRFMATADVSERSRLCPVIATLLEFTAAERHVVMEAVSGHTAVFDLGAVIRRSMAGL